MRRRIRSTPILLAVLTLALLATQGFAAGDEASLLGFRPQRVEAQLELEAAFDGQLDAESPREWMREMTARPHNVGSPQARSNAERIAELFRSWGFDTEIEVYRVLFPRPRVRALELVAPTRFRASLDEPIVEGDSSSRVARREGLPPYNAYSGEGDVSGELVYVNHGVPDDYEELARRGIDVSGKIVLARYGGSWRGIKPKVAAEHGAIGCILYSDPRGDGYSEGATYPEGPYKTAGGVQRGSVIDLPLRPGDPLTPMRGATEDAERLGRDEAETLMRIPVLPISWSDAQPLLEALEGPVAPEPWRGALPLTYRLGPGPAKVHLQVELDWDLVPAYDVIARLAGSERPDQWIVRGNHHDAWVIGADDPTSGLVALLSEARAIGALAKGDWKPKRTLVYAAWDAEEPGLLGSTEWAEHHAEALRAHAVVYVNSDSNGRGFLRMGGSHALEPLMNQVAAAVPDPQTDGSVADRLRSLLVLRASGDERRRLLDGGALGLAALGSGSDYSAFLQHLGIASLNLGFGGENGGGEYHTAFDTFDFYTRFGDPTFEYNVALAKTAGRAVLRLAEADVLPFDFAAAARTFAAYVAEVEALAETRRREIEERNRILAAGHFTRAADPTETFVPPSRETVPPHLNFAPLLNARDRLERAAEAWTGALTGLSAETLPAAERLAAADRIVLASERALTRDEGLPRRPWYRHHVYAPGFYTGYGVKTLPGVREAIEEGRWDEAEEQIDRAAEVFAAYAAEIERSAAALSAE
jgi:N-acetylated-alpha-linked acidic dipeptidase